MSLREASRYFNIAKSTLGRRILGKNKIACGRTKHLGRFMTTFTPEFEGQLTKYAKEMESRFFGITMMDLQRLAFQLAERNELNHQFNKNKRMAGKKWVKNFLRRQSSLSLRRPEPTSYARAVGFNKPAVQKFFSLLNEIIEKYGLDGSRIYNCDESGMKTVQQQHSKVFASKGKKQVGAMTSAERGKNVTVVCATNACGHYIPPMFIFPRKRMNLIFMDHAPPCSKGHAQESGWMTMELFKDYLEHFVEMVKPTVEKPACLLLDGHSSHTRNIDALDYATANGVVLLSLPPHTTHRLQPLDVGFFKPLQTYYDQFICTWLRSHPGRTFTEYQVAEAFNVAFGKAATVATARNAFEKCGIWPFNPHVFTDDDYAAAETTEQPYLASGLQSTSGACSSDVLQTSPGVRVQTDDTSSAIVGQNASPDVSCHDAVHEKNLNPVSDQDDVGLTATVQQNESPVDLNISPLVCGQSDISLGGCGAAICVSPYDIAPLPQAPSVNRSSRKRLFQSATVLTATPHKKILREKKKVKPEKETKKPSSQRRNVKSKKQINSDDNTPCCICSKKYNEPPLDSWTQCSKCRLWFHDSCGPEDIDTCYFCL